MARTNIDIDDDLLARAMARYRLRTKREAVDLALRRLVGDEFVPKDMLEMRGSGWDGDLAAMRGDGERVIW